MPLLRVLRRAGDEVQWTQLIAAIAGEDDRFAAKLARVLVDAAKARGMSSDVPRVPDRLQCRREVSLQDSAGNDVGRIDLLFEDAARSFCLLVELKLASEYHHGQLPNYMDALDALPATEKGLVAVTPATPHTGEEGLAGRTGWLGSLRWHALFDPFYALEHRDLALGDAWRSTLQVMRNQQDFGPMDLTLGVIESWAKRDEAERILRYLLMSSARRRSVTFARGSGVRLTTRRPPASSTAASRRSSGLGEISHM